MAALKFAVKRSTPKVLQALIDAGAEVDGPPETDQTALMLAARANNVAALKVLVKNGANVSLACKLPWAEGRTAEGLAELAKQRAAFAYLRRLRGG
jgi:ankyrin repeat protein